MDITVRNGLTSGGGTMNVAPGTTVSSLLGLINSLAAYPREGRMNELIVRVDGKVATPDRELHDGETVSVTKAELKGAA